jgi:hypothetical protein
MSYIKLEANYTEHVPGGMSIGNVGLTTTLNNGTRVEFPMPFVSIGNGLAITPAVNPNGDAGLRMDFTRWTPLRYGANRTAGFPLEFRSQDLAVRVARAFDADPSTRWGCTADEARAWLNTWAAANPALFPVPEGGGGR